MDLSKVKYELSDDQLHILRDRGTEAPFSGEYVDLSDDGVYLCAACGNKLFSSDTKFDAHCGWPSFYDVANNQAVTLLEDNSHGMRRTEVRCANCGGHLGHIFYDAPDQPTGNRYCINSLSLKFDPMKAKQK